MRRLIWVCGILFSEDGRKRLLPLPPLLISLLLDYYLSRQLNQEVNCLTISTFWPHTSIDLRGSHGVHSHYLVSLQFTFKPSLFAADAFATVLMPSRFLNTNATLSAKSRSDRTLPAKSMPNGYASSALLITWSMTELKSLGAAVQPS